MFAAIFPDLIEKLVMIDIVKPVSYPAQVQPDKSAKAINSYMQVMHKLQQPPPSYTYIYPCLIVECLTTSDTFAES